MHVTQAVRSGPNQYICEAGALKYLPEKLLAFKHPIIVTGKLSYQAFQDFSSLKMKIPVLEYDGTASRSDISRLAVKAKKADVIIGIGGGRLLDTAKGVADLLHCEVITIPTIVSTCSASTSIGNIYSDDVFFKETATYARCPYLCLIDLDLLVASPKRYFLAGIGGTLAKWYEAECLSRHVSKPFSPMITMGLEIAKLARNTLWVDTSVALENIETRNVTPAFQRVTEAIIGLGGAVGGFSGECGNQAGAHAIQNALTFMDETHSLAHGLKVAYGILIQLAAMGEEEEVKKLIPFYRKHGFVYNFDTLGITSDHEDVQHLIATYAAKREESFALAIPDISPKTINKAIVKVEELTSQYSSEENSQFDTIS